MFCVLSHDVYGCMSVWMFVCMNVCQYEFMNMMSSHMCSSVQLSSIGKLTCIYIYIVKVFT